MQRSGYSSKRENPKRRSVFLDMLCLGLVPSCHKSPSPRPLRDRLGESRMWEDNRYFWVVLCKNRWFHIRESLSLNYRQRIPLGETDALTLSPIGNSTFNVRCDKCGKEYTYGASDVLKFEMEPPESFSPHPLFAEGATDSPAVVEHRTSQD